MLKAPLFSSKPCLEEANNGTDFLLEAVKFVQSDVLKVPSVLLVDDDADSLLLLDYILRQFICTPIFATEGPSALELARNLQPDLILLDIWLPGINGFEIARALRGDSATQTIPIIAVTALASEKDRQKILRAGCTQYISKPYFLEEMEALLNHYLSLRP